MLMKLHDFFELLSPSKPPPPPPKIVNTRYGLTSRVTDLLEDYPGTTIKWCTKCRQILAYLPEKSPEILRRGLDYCEHRFLSSGDEETLWRVGLWAPGSWGID